jgi:non-ribosomal peptide synthetase component F
VQEECVSYAELDRRANQLAHRLIALGVGPEVPVGVMMERSMDLIVALLGVLKAGGAYVPMDPSYPPGRLALMMEDSEVRVRPALLKAPNVFLRIAVSAVLHHSQAPVLLSQMDVYERVAVPEGAHVLLVRSWHAKLMSALRRDILTEYHHLA